MISLTTLLQLIITVIFFGGLFGIKFIRSAEKTARENNIDDTIFETKKEKNTKRFWLQTFYILIKIPLISKVVRKLQRMYTNENPLDNRAVMEKTAQSFIKMALANLVVLLAISLLTSSFYIWCITAIVLYFVDVCRVFDTLEKEDLNLLKDFNSFIGDVRRHYFDTGMIDESIFNSIETAPKSIKLHAERMYQILELDDYENELQKYLKIVPNCYLKLFMALAQITQTYGSRTTEDGDTFLSNLKDLKEMTYEEVLKRNKINHEFMGVTPLIMYPIFALEPIKRWGISTSPAMDSFYNGSSGYLVIFIIFVTIVGLLQLSLNMRSNDVIAPEEHYVLARLLENDKIYKFIKNLQNKNYASTVKLGKTLKRLGERMSTEQFMLKKFLVSIATFIVCLIFFNAMHIINKNNTLSSVATIDQLVSGLTSDDETQLRESILYYTDYFKGNTIVDDTDTTQVLSKKPLLARKGPSPVQTKSGNPFSTGGLDHVMSDGTLNVPTLSRIISCDKSIKSTAAVNAAAKEIVKRIIKYQNEYFKWFEMSLSVIIAYAMFYAPDIILSTKKKKLRHKMDDEVILFQTIIMMLSPIEKVTIQEILEWLELFAFIFRDSITEGLNALNNGELEALDLITTREEFEPFNRVIENLKTSDRIGIKKAFNDVQIEKKNYQQVRKQENDIEIDNKGALTRLMVLAPTLVVIIFYLAVPFVSSSFEQLQETTEAMEELQ